MIVWARSSAFRSAAAFGHCDPDGYPKEAEVGEVDQVCLSRANDADYEKRIKSGNRIDVENKKAKYTPFDAPAKKCPLKF